MRFDDYPYSNFNDYILLEEEKKTGKHKDHKQQVRGERGSDRGRTKLTE